MGDRPPKMLAPFRRAFAPAMRATQTIRHAQANFASKSTVPALPDVLPAGELVGDLEGVNGLRREEIEAELMGGSRFETEWAGPAGTKESPIVVESTHDERIVGIPSVDDHGEEGELKWFKLKASDGTVEHHGQHFVLKQVSADVEAGFERSH